MATSFSLGFEQVRDELILMQPSGCYWVTANRQEDARVLARQCISAQRLVALITSGSQPQALLTPAPPGGPDAIPMFSLPETRKALLNLTDDLDRVLSEKPRLVILFTASLLWEKIAADEVNIWLKQLQQWLSGKKITLLIITAGSGINNLRNHLQTCYRHLKGFPISTGSRTAGITALTGGRMAAACWPTAPCDSAPRKRASRCWIRMSKIRR